MGASASAASAARALPAAAGCGGSKRGACGSSAAGNPAGRSASPSCCRRTLGNVRHGTAQGHSSCRKTDARAHARCCERVPMPSTNAPLCGTLGVCAGPVAHRASRPLPSLLQLHTALTTDLPGPSTPPAAARTRARRGARAPRRRPLRRRSRRVPRPPPCRGSARRAACWRSSARRGAATAALRAPAPAKRTRRPACSLQHERMCPCVRWPAPPPRRRRSQGLARGLQRGVRGYGELRRGRISQLERGEHAPAGIGGRDGELPREPQHELLRRRTRLCDGQAEGGRVGRRGAGE